MKESSSKKMEKALDKMFAKADEKEYMLVHYKGNDGHMHWHRLSPMMLYLEPTKIIETEENENFIERREKICYKVIDAEYGRYKIGVVKFTTKSLKFKYDYEEMQIIFAEYNTSFNYFDALIHIAFTGSKRILKLLRRENFQDKVHYDIVKPEIFDKAFGFSLA